MTEREEFVVTAATVVFGAVGMIALIVAMVMYWGSARAADVEALPYPWPRCVTGDCGAVQAPPVYSAGSGITMTVPCVDQFPGIAEFAERLGFDGREPLSNATVIVTCDGRKYDIFALGRALLDRMDKAAK